MAHICGEIFGHTLSSAEDILSIQALETPFQVREFQPESPGIWALNCRESRRFSAKKSRDSLPGEAENLRVENSRPTCLPGMTTESHRNCMESIRVTKNEVPIQPHVTMRTSVSEVKGESKVSQRYVHEVRACPPTCSMRGEALMTHKQTLLAGNPDIGIARCWPGNLSRTS
jgi:hypothetical protein